MNIPYIVTPPSKCQLARNMRSRRRELKNKVAEKEPCRIHGTHLYVTLSIPLVLKQRQVCEHEPVQQLPGLTRMLVRRYVSECFKQSAGRLDRKKAEFLGKSDVVLFADLSLILDQEDAELFGFLRLGLTFFG